MRTQPAGLAAASSGSGAAAPAGGFAAPRASRRKASAGWPNHLTRKASRSNAPTAGECGRPRTVIMFTWRQNSGATIGSPTTPGCFTEFAGIKAQPRPVATAPIDGFALDVLGGEDGIGVAREFAVHAMDVAFAVEIGDADRAGIRQPVARVDGGNDLLAEERHDVGALVRLASGQAIDRHLEATVEKPLLQVPRIGVAELQLDAGMPLLDRADQVDDLIRRDGAHDAELEHGVAQMGEVLGAALGFQRFPVDLLEMRPDHAAELGQMRVGPLAMEERPAQLFLERFYGAGQRRLGDVAMLGRPGEIELVRNGEEIADLMHLHEIPLSLASDRQPADAVDDLTPVGAHGKNRTILARRWAAPPALARSHVCVTSRSDERG